MNFSLKPKSFEEVKQYLLDKINAKYPTLGLILFNSILMIIIDIIAWAIALFMDFADNLNSEKFLFSATQYENARLEAKYYGYQAHRKISSKGTIRIGVNSDFNTTPLESITFQKFDSLKINGITFLINQTSTLSSNPTDNSYQGLPANTWYIDVPVIQGELIQVSNIATGDQNESIIINDENVENSYVKVYVNGNEYTQVDSFFLSDSEDEHCVVENLAYLRGIKVLFGNGFRGSKLSPGDDVLVEYIQTSGTNGNVLSQGFDINFITTYTFSTSAVFNPYGISISKMIGSSDIEELESIKFWGQKSANYLENFIANNNDLQVEIQKYGGILKSRAFSEYDLDPINPNSQFNSVIKILLVPESGTQLDTLTKTDIRLFLKEKLGFTDFIEFIDVVYLDIYFEIDAEVFVSAPQNIGTTINTYLQDVYELGSKEIGVGIDHSSVIYNLSKDFFEQIKRLELVLKIMEEYENPSIQTGNIITQTLKLNNLRNPEKTIKSLKIELEYTKSSIPGTETVYDDSMGSISPLNTGVGDAVISGSIDYITGDVVIDLDANVDSVEKITYFYETFDVDGANENIDIKFNQIIRYGGANIDIEYVEATE